MFNRKGFTLVELMIVVAIIGILAAIAIPNFISMQYKAKRGELPTNVKAIKTSEIQYESAYSAFVNCAEYPSGVSKTTRPWVVASSGGFETLNWMPDGDVRGSYAVTTSGGSGQKSDFTIVAISDVDGDQVNATYTATKSSNPTNPTTDADVY